MTIMIRWYSRHGDMKPNYNEEHHGTISGEDANDCWRQFIEFKHTFDLARNTIPEICGMYN